MHDKYLLPCKWVVPNVKMTKQTTSTIPDQNTFYLVSIQNSTGHHVLPKHHRKMSKERDFTIYI